MQNFDYWTPTRLIFGKGSISELPDALRPLAKRPPYSPFKERSDMKNAM